MKAISILNLKGGVGKTVTSVNMAYILAADHKKRVLDDLTHGGMSLEKCEKKIREFARGHGGCCTGAESEKIIREYFGLPDAQRAPEQEQPEKPADDVIDLEAFF